MRMNKTEVMVSLGKLYRYLAIFISTLILILPIVVVVAISFNPSTREAFPPTGFSFRWYSEFFANEAFFEAFFYTSIPVALATAVLATTLGVLSAYAIIKYDLALENVIQSFLTMPIMVPAVIIGISLLLFFGELSIGNDYVELILGHTIRVVPYAVLTTLTALYGIDWEIESAARNLGANPITSFYKIVLPLMSSGVIASFLLTFIISFADINIALFLSGRQATTIPVEMYNFLQFETSPVIAAISTLQILVVLVLVVGISFLVDLESIFAN